MKLKSLLLYLLFVGISAQFAWSNEAPWAPDFLILGAQKAGTTALYDFLNQHPKVVKKKHEVHFFDLNFQKGTSWYIEQFPQRPASGYLIGDKSPYYLPHPYVPERVHTLYPNVKLIAILRNPIERAYSQYCMNCRAGTERLSFENALEAEAERLKGQVENMKDPAYNCIKHRRFSYLTRGVYVEQIKNWLEYFPKEQLLVISADELRKDGNATANKVFEFLGISPFKVSIDNPDMHSSYEPMYPATRKRLAEYYRPFNAQLEKLLGRQLNWE